MEITDNIKKDFKQKLLEEGMTRLTQCCGYLSEDEIWHKPNTNSNSVAVILAHLEGNVRQYIISGLGGKADERQRDAEFELIKGNVTSEELLNKLHDTVREAISIVERIEADVLMETRDVQCFSMTGLSIIIHVIEHFSYHLGQVVYYTKYIKDMDTGFYKGLKL
jgi:uncharacterized damage-inducible protein DinB